MKKDFEIAQAKEMLPILEVAKKIGIFENDLELYGNYKAKVKDVDQNMQGNVILVTAMSPTPFGEGKTTVAIGLHDAFWRKQKKSLLTLREPSMGPVFGLKGGATGGGYAQVLPMEDINLHFNGDFHAITSANNLISAMIDNSLKHGNPLHLDPEQIFFHRTMDLNDRVLREVYVGLGSSKNGVERKEEFTITSACEMMAIFGMSKDMEDLRNRIDQIVIGLNQNQEFVLVKDLNITGAVLALLKDAMKPNLVQTLEENPVLIHGGPFANIAPGVNTIRAINMARKLAPYVITEAGFGADLGGFKFLDIVARQNDFKPSVVVLVATIKAIKYHGGVNAEDILKENLDALKSGLSNLQAHMDNLKQLKVNFLVTLNRYATDLDTEISIVRDYVTQQGISFVVNDVHRKGGEGALLLCEEVMKYQSPSMELLYQDDDDLVVKIEKVCKNLFHAKTVTYSNKAIKNLELFQASYSHFPLCFSKTQYSISDNPKKLGYPKDYTIHVSDLRVSAGAGFIIVYLGDIVAMPGLNQNPAACLIDVVDDKIINIF